MTGYFINSFALFITSWLFSKSPCCRNKRGSLNIESLLEPMDITVKIGSTVYTARGFFKPKGKTLSEKLLRNMEKELEKDENLCYSIIKSQKGLDCKQERSIV